METPYIKRRCVIWIGDYEPTDAAQQFSSFERHLQQFAQTWNLKARNSPVAMRSGEAVAVWISETKGPDWQVETEFRLFNWSDLIRGDFAAWGWQPVWYCIRALADFVWSRTLFRYFRSNWRFALLFCYPALIVLAGLLSCVAIGSVLGAFGLPLPFWCGLLISGAAILAYLRWIDPTVPPRILRLWIFLYDVVHLKRAGLPERLGIFAQDLLEQLQYQDADEILIVAHGLGAVLQPIVIDRAFWHLPKSAKEVGRSLSVMSAGSLLLAVGLHPEADWLMGPVSRIARDRTIFWVEYQAQDDVLNFPRLNPSAELIDDYGRPILKAVRISEMRGAPVKRLPLRLIYNSHWQFVRPNPQRYAYDFFMICCGPHALRMRVKNAGGLLEAFAADTRIGLLNPAERQSP
jgi:hypothetical protein